MKKEKKYEEHVIRRWNFSKELAEKIANEDIYNALTISIFDKTCTPYYYFMPDDNSNETLEKSTTKQIKYAKDHLIKTKMKLIQELNSINGILSERTRKEEER